MYKISRFTQLEGAQTLFHLNGMRETGYTGYGGRPLVANIKKVQTASILFISLSLWPEAIFFVFGVNGFQSHATFTDNHLITNPLCNGRAFSLASDLYQKVLAREEKYSHVKGLKFSNHILLTSDRGSHPTHPILDNQIINLRLRFSPLQRRGR